MPQATPDDEGSRRPTRNRLAPLATPEDQLQWLDNWMLLARPGGRSQAERVVWRYLRSANRTGDLPEAEELVVRATNSAYRRLKRRVTDGPPIPETGHGFRGFARVVLLNEVRRGLARSARRHARRLASGEGWTVVLSRREGLVPMPWSEVSEIQVDVWSWPHAWDQHQVQVLESRLEAGSLEISTPLSIQRLKVAGRDANDDPYHLVFRTTGVDRFRVANHGLAGIHVRVEIVSFTSSDGLDLDLKPRRLIDSTRGIGIPIGDPAILSGRGEDAVASPWRFVPSRSGLGNPRRVAGRTFVACPSIDASDADRVKRAVSEYLKAEEVKKGSGWLSAPNVVDLATEIWDQASSASPSELGDLVCALAEWQEPGIHAGESKVYPPLHPGSHPLDPPIREAVSRRFRSVPSSPVNSSAARQARSRLSRRVARLLGRIGHLAHSEMSQRGF